MIDVNQPIELDDGRPAKIIDVRGSFARVEINGPWSRIERDKGRHVWSYELKTGWWCGATDREAFVIRNVVDEPVIEEDWS